MNNAQIKSLFLLILSGVFFLAAALAFIFNTTQGTVDDYIFWILLFIGSAMLAVSSAIFLAGYIKRVPFHGLLTTIAVFAAFYFLISQSFHLRLVYYHYLLQRSGVRVNAYEGHCDAILDLWAREYRHCEIRFSDGRMDRPTFATIPRDAAPIKTIEVLYLPSNPSIVEVYLNGEHFRERVIIHSKK